MFVLGHLGIGRAMVRPWTRRDSAWLLALGMLLPDLIDKPLYYARLSAFFSCTRTIGHTGLLTVTVLAIGVVWQRRGAIAVAIGMGTHLVLDCLLDGLNADGSTWRAVSWPFLHGTFAAVYSPSMLNHLGRLVTTPIVACEVIGAALICWELWGRTGRTKPSTPSRP